MKPKYLMKYARYKYKTLLDKGVYESPDEKQTHIIALQTEINSFKSKRTGDHKNISVRK